MKIKHSVKTILVYALTFVLVLVSTCIPSVSANDDIDSLKEQQDRIQAEIEAYERKVNGLANDISKQTEYIDTLRRKITAEQSEIDIISNRIRIFDNKINALNNQIEKVNYEIVEIEKQSEETQIKIDETKALLEKRLNAAYKAGETSNLEILLSSSDFSTFLTRLELITGIAKQDSKLMKEFMDDIKELNKLKESLEQKKSQLAKDKQELEASRSTLDTELAQLQSKQDSLTASQQQVQNTISKLDKDSAEYKRRIQQQQAELDAIDAKIAEIARQGSSTEDGSQAPASGSLIWPLPYSNTYITSLFGPARLHPVYGVIRPHNGLDISLSGALGRNIVAVQSGVVLTASYGYNYGWGNYIMIDHGGGIKTLYAHCQSLKVSVGARVEQGQVIATVGSTGASTGPHLHIEVYVNGTRVDPLNYLTVPAGIQYYL